MKGFYEFEKDRIVKDSQDLNQFIIDEKNEVKGFYEYEINKLVDSRKSWRYENSYKLTS